MNMFKKNGGFTLVELIVVIAILAILAGVAVPVYSGYIAKANEAADYTALDAVKTAAVFAHTEAVAKDVNSEPDDYTVSKIEVSGGKVYINGSTSETDVTAYTTVPTTFKSGASKATWNAATDTTDAGWTLE